MRYVYDADSDALIRTEEADPACGDYCENCGDCLRCHADAPCRNGGNHWWVIYEEKNSRENELSWEATMDLRTLLGADDLFAFVKAHVDEIEDWREELWYSSDPDDIGLWADVDWLLAAYKNEPQFGYLMPFSEAEENIRAWGGKS